MNNWVTELYSLHPAFCREILRLVVMYCPEGPFLWFGPEEKSLEEYQKWSPKELAQLLGKPGWLIADFVPITKQRQVMELMDKNDNEMVYFPTTRLGIVDGLTPCSLSNVMYFCDSHDLSYGQLTCDEDILEDSEVRDFYFETIKNRKRSNKSDFSWSLDAVELYDNCVVIQAYDN